MLKWGIIIVLISILTLECKAGSSSSVIDHTNNTTVSVKTYIHVKSKKPSKASYTLYAGSKKNLATCVGLDPTEFGSNFTFRDGAVLIFGSNGCSFGDHTKLVQRVNGSIAIIASGVPFATTSYNFGMGGIDIPIFFISFPDASLLLKTIGKNASIKKSTVINLIEEDNLWIKVGAGGFWIFLEVILLLSYAFDWIIGIRAIILHINKEGFKPTIAQTTIWINLAGTFIFAMFIFDAWNIRYISSSTFASIMLTLYPPTLLTSVFFLSFFFNEILISKGFLKPQLSTLKFPFALVCMTCWGAYIADAVYFGSNRSNVNLIKTVTLMNVLFFSIAEIYFLTVGILIVIKLKVFDSPIIKRIIPLITVISFGIALFIVGAIIETAQAFSVYEPRKSLANFSLYFISSFFIFTPQFIFFREPKLIKSANSGSNKLTTPPTASKKMVQLN